ncbi:MAG: hypothetical protein ABFD75_12120 [Smithella sp.]
MSNRYETYGEMFGDYAKRLAKAKDGGIESICRILGIKYFHYRKVINPNNETNEGRPYTLPVEWVVQATNYSARDEADGVPGDYCMIKQIAHDTRGRYLSPVDLRELKASLAGAAPDILAILQKITGEVKAA